MSSVLHRRRLQAVGAVVAMCVMLASGLIIGYVFRPSGTSGLEEQTEPIQVWAPVENRVVADGPTLSGTVTAPAERPVTVRNLTDGDVVVRRVKKPGDPVRGGDLLAVISNRPYIGLNGPLAGFRDLRIGDSGDDVALLQKALTRAGFKTRSTGTVTSTTMQAAQRLFRSHGFSLPRHRREDAGPSDEQADSSSAPPTAAADTQPTTNRQARPSAAEQEPFIPATQLVDLPMPDGRVLSSVSVGAAPGDSAVLVLTKPGAFVEAFVDVETSSHLRSGQQVEVQEGAETVSGTIVRLGEITNDESDDGRSGRRVTVELNGNRPWPPARKVIIRTAAAGRARPAVPQTAVRTDAAGDYVLMRPHRDSDAPIRINVRVTASDGGFAAITGDISPGAEVLVT